MIVTCPNCAAKYRVRDEAVPEEGAELECPECATHFLAQRPKGADLQTMVEKLRDANAILEERLKEKTRAFDLMKAEHDAARAALEAQRAQLETARVQVESLRHDAQREVRTRDDEIARLRAEVDAGSAECARLVQMKSDVDREVTRLAGELQRAQLSAPSGPAVDPELQALVASASPLLWGLERAIEYLDPFAKADPQLQSHTRQLTLLSGFLTRIVEKGGPS